MDISKYASFFHDGGIFDIRHEGDSIEFFMTSAEMAEEDLQDDIPLSRYDTIQGKLHVKGVKSIMINKKPFLGTLKKAYESAEVLDFILTRNSVELGVLWSNYPYKIEERDFTTIEIEAEKIWWENIPNLESSLDE